MNIIVQNIKADIVFIQHFRWFFISLEGAGD